MGARITARPWERTPIAVGWSPNNRPPHIWERKVNSMTVKEEIQLRLSGVTSAEIKDLKEREKLEQNPPADEPKNDPPADEPKNDPPADETKNEPENVSRETSEDTKLKEENEQLKTQLAKLQEENTHRDNSGEVDNRDDFTKCVDIFKNAF